MDPPAECTKEKVQSPNRSQKSRVKVPKSKERSNVMKMMRNEQNCATDHKKVKSISKLPRIIRSPSAFYKRTKSSPKLREPLDDAGDVVPGTSKMVHFPTNIPNEESSKEEKLKPSQIPRRRCLKEGSRDSSESRRRCHFCQNNKQFLPEGRNVQRIHMLINPDFCPPEEHTQPASVASTRPIPTLGQIYGRINMIDSDRLNEWFMEINTPLSSVSGRPRAVNSEDNDCNASTIASPANCHQEVLGRSAILLDRKDKNMEGFGTAATTTHDTIHGWFAADLEYPTRDNESGYQTMSYSPPQKLTSRASIVDGTSVKTNTTFCLMDEAVDVEIFTAEPNVECGTATSSLLSEQPTVLLCKTRESIKQKVEEGTGMSHHIDINTKKSSSDENLNETIATPGRRMPVPSYTECFSEILQKTTNFENPDGSIPKTPSSIAITDIEVRDNLSNDGAMDQDELCILEEQSNMEWSRQHYMPTANCTFTKSDGTSVFGTVNDWSSKYRSEGSEACTNSSDNHQGHWNSWKQEISRRYFDDRNLDFKERCKRCHRFKKFPSNRFKTQRPVGPWRRRISFRRICRRRWNYVWKKTAERWALWSSRSPAKFRKIRVMQCLQRSIVWEDADAQTTILVYNEMGTDSALAERKSAAIGTVVNMNSWQPASNKDSVNKSGSRDKPKFRHVNLGPSMFPFLYDSKKKSLSLQTSDRGQSRPKLLYYTNKDGNRSARQSDNITWNIEHGVDMERMVKSCQFEESIPGNVERSTSFYQMTDFNTSDVFTDTEDLRYFMNDKVTSTTVRFNPYQLRNATSKDAYTQKVITCNNAEADVRFFPHLESMSTGTLTSGCDITYYRPMTGTDITHLITETRAQQALYPILRNYLPRTPNTETVTRQPSNETETQVSTEKTVPKVSLGVATSVVPPIANSNHSSNTEDTLIQKSVDRKNCSTQIQPPEAIAETQISPRASVSKTSTGISPSNPKFTGKRTSSFISACVLMDSETEKESYSIQTSSHKPKLACTATKIMSISSRALTDKNLSCTEITMNKPPHKSTGNLTQALCPCKTSKVSCGSDRKHCHECSKSTSSRGLESYYETEILLNNLIKKALVGVNSSPTRASRKRSHATTGSDAAIGFETKATGPTLSEMKQLIDVGDKTDTGVQYSMLDKPGKPEMDFHASATKAQSQLLSMCMLNQQTTDTNTQTEWNAAHCVPVPPSVCSSPKESSCCSHADTKQNISTKITKTIAEKPGEPYDGPSVNNTETNTDLKFPPNIELELDQSQKSSIDKRPVEACSCSTRNKSMAEIQNNLNSQLISLSRMIGKRRPTAALNPSITASVFTADYGTDKWMTSGKSKSTFTSLVGFEASPTNDIKTNTLYITKALQSDDEDTNKVITIGPPTIILSRDSLADVLPVKKSIHINACVKKMNQQQCVNRTMVDRVTSDENVTKDVKESMLQACPDICETGTESVLQACQKKSASVLTTLCVLPAPPLLCNAKQKMEKRDTECVFVYGEPKCAVHKDNIDVAVQFYPPCDQEVNVKKQCVNQSVGVLNSYSTINEEKSQRKPHALIGEVLSPKVYKALYETTKLVVNEEVPKPPFQEKITRVDAEVEAAKFHVPDVRSAGVVTSKYRGFGFPQRCYCRDRGTHPNTSKWDLKQLYNLKELGRRIFFWNKTTRFTQLIPRHIVGN
ncbi:uncharacterized protein LOC113495199 isoform X3 [Trichoplusia ni]|uniref:Uncharacterized protein LOC113495199 isoform X3 n=1 Tax=Trichoplusia ni TaxID=7111 RepID=A0A7E5VMW0_TRINI|nr:uncharacterized protein LOC113495199 isoform X3 [Trichoplusia ni]